MYSYSRDHSLNSISIMQTQTDILKINIFEQHNPYIIKKHFIQQYHSLRWCSRIRYTIDTTVWKSKKNRYFSQICTFLSKWKKNTLFEKNTDFLIQMLCIFSQNSSYNDKSKDVQVLCIYCRIKGSFRRF